MKLRMGLVLAAVVALAAWAVLQAPVPKNLAGFVPTGPVLYVETGDLAGLVRDWNASGEKKLWLKSANYKVFEQSRLFQRLEGVQGEFTAAAGLKPDMSLMEAAAGGASAFALYDIGKLEFLYITYLPSARVMETALWKTRSSYETRKAAGFDYFVHTDAASQRTAAFAVANDYMLIATREDLLPAALKLMAGAGGSAVATEGWYATAVRAAGEPGEIRMVMNMPALITSPQFRSYWVQRNVSELKQYGAAISDIYRSAEGIREQRVLLRQGELPQAVDGAAMGRVLALVPAEASVYRAWAKPSAADAVRLLTSRVIEPQAQGGRPSEMAPSAPETTHAGSESDLETRIDEPPLENTGGGFASEALQRILEGAGIEAMALVSSSRGVPGGVFVGTDSAVALAASSEWNADAVRAALSTAAESGPLARLRVEARGRILIISNAEALARTIAARIPNAAEVGGSAYAARFNLARERASFQRMTRLIDHPTAPEESTEPRFFSQNLASLGRTLSRFESSSIVVTDKGSSVEQTVNYRFTK